MSWLLRKESINDSLTLEKRLKVGKLELMKGAQDSAEEYLDEKEFVLLQNMVESAVRRETSLDFTRGKYEVIFHSMHMKDGRFVGRNAEYARNLAEFD